jgi:putative membrane protein
MYLLIALIVNTLAFLITSYLLSSIGIGFRVDGIQTAIVAAIILGVVNTFIKPILALITLPLTILTLGLFVFILNAIMLFITSFFVKGLVIDGWLPAIVGAIVLSIVSTLLSTFLKAPVKE